MTQAVLEETLLMAGVPVQAAIGVSEAIVKTGRASYERRLMDDDAVFRIVYKTDGSWVLEIRE